MDEEKEKIIEEEMDIEEPSVKIGLNRKFTCYHKEEQEEDDLLDNIGLCNSYFT